MKMSDLAAPPTSALARPYVYGARKPIEGHEVLNAQLALANRYYNDRLQLELTRRAAVYFGCDKAEVRDAYNEAARALYRDYTQRGLGHQTIRYLGEDANKAARTRWRCWSKTGRFRSPYRRFDRTGYLAANSQHGAREWARIDVVDERRKHALCHLRVTSAQTLNVPFKLDRPLPAAADVASVKLHVRRHGDRFTYELSFLARNYIARQLPRAETGACAVNFGWRRVNGGVRVATAVGDDGHETVLVLPDRMIGARKHAEQLASLADAQAVDHLGESRARHRARREALAGKGPSAIVRLPYGAAAVPPELAREHWARRDRHLWQWECDERRKMLAQRREIYRLWVRGLRARYASVSIESFSLAELIRQATEPETPRLQAARHIRFLVAPGMLRAEIALVFGDRCQDLNVGKRTKRCHACRRVCKFDAAAELSHECEHCGAFWDQDVNNATNQLIDTAAE